MIYVILLLSLVGSYLNGSESEQEARPEHVFPLQLQKHGEEPEHFIEWLAYILLSNKSNRNPELQVVRNIKTMKSTLWLTIDHKDNPAEKQIENLSSLLQDANVQELLTHRLHQYGYIAQSLRKRMELAEESIKPKHQSLGAFHQDNGDKKEEILGYIEGMTCREYLNYEHNVFRDEYQTRSDSYKKVYANLISDMRWSAVGYGLAGGAVGAACAKLSDRSFSIPIGAGIFVGALFGAGKVYKNKRESLRKPRQEVEEIELRHNNSQLLEKEIARFAPDLRDKAESWGRKVLPCDPRVFTSYNPA